MRRKEPVYAVNERGPQPALGLNNKPDSRVCVTSDLCMRADEWDALQRTVDCWGRPGSWELDPANAALHGRKWHRTDGRPLSSLPVWMRYAWAPESDPGACDAAANPLLPFYKSDFCALLRKRRILLVGDLMNNQFREAIADAGAPGGGPAWRPKTSKSPKPSKRVPAASESPEPEPSPEPEVDVDASAEGSEDYGESDNATDTGADDIAVVEESEEEEESAAVAGDDADSEADYGEDAASKAAKAAEALLGEDRDSIGRDGVTSDVERDVAGDGDSGEEESARGRRRLEAWHAFQQFGDGLLLEEEGRYSHGLEHSHGDAADASLGSHDSGSGSAASGAGASGDALRRLAGLRAEAAAVAARRAAGISAAGTRHRDANGTGASSPRELRAAFSGAVSRICDRHLATTVEYKRNDRLYVDGDRIPRARNQGFWEFRWIERVPQSEVVILSRPVTVQPDRVYFATLRRALQRIRAANPRALVIVRNVAPPHVDCLAQGAPLAKRQPEALLKRTGHDGIHGQNEALRLFLRTEFPGVLHLDIATPTSLRPDTHSSGECIGYQSPGPVDHWVRLLFNALRLVERAAALAKLKARGTSG